MSQQSHEGNEKFSYKGGIEKEFTKKVLLKTNIVLIPILVVLSILYIWVYISTTVGIEFVFWMLLYTVIIPFLGINIPVALYFKVYVRTFSYEVLGDHILINHGVFTKTRARIPYTRVQNINIVHGVFDRMFQLYTLKIETAGSSGMASAAASHGAIRPEGYIPGLGDPEIIENKINEMVNKYSAVPSGLEDKIFKPEEIAFDNFISYIISKLREGEKLDTNIRRLREEKNLKPADLAEYAGVPLHTIQYLEEGRYNPSLALAYKIADVLECPIEDLFKMK